MLLVVVDGVCMVGGLIGMVWIGFGWMLGICGVVVWVCVLVKEVNISVVVSSDFMINLVSLLNVLLFKYILLVVNNVVLV